MFTRRNFRGSEYTIQNRFGETLQIFADVEFTLAVQMEACRNSVKFLLNANRAYQAKNLARVFLFQIPDEPIQQCPDCPGVMTIYFFRANVKFISSGQM